MNWRDIPSLAALRAFEAAARTGSFSAAARELNVTHAAVAQHVRHLEDHFTTSLMTRQGRAMATTAEGDRLAGSLAEAFGTIESAARDLLDRGKARPLRVATTPSFAANWLMPRIGLFWSSHPEIELELIPGIDLLDLRRDGIDVAIRYGLGGWPGVESRPFVPAGMVAVATPGLIGDRTIACLADLCGLVWLLDGTRSEERLFARENGVDLEAEKVRSFATAQLAREAARAGLGVAIMPEPLVADDIARGQLLALCRDGNSKVAYHILTRPGTVSARRDAFVTWLTAEAAAS